MSSYSVFEARNSLSRLIAESRSGAEVVIANRGTPVAKLVPIEELDSAITGASVAAWLDAHPVPQRLRRGTAELEQQIAENREAWE